MEIFENEGFASCEMMKLKEGGDVCGGGVCGWILIIKKGGDVVSDEFILIRHFRPSHFH